MTSDEFLAGELRERVVRKSIGSGNTSSPNSVQQQDAQNNVHDNYKEDGGYQMNPQGRTPDGTGR